MPVRTLPRRSSLQNQLLSNEESPIVSTSQCLPLSPSQSLNVSLEQALAPKTPVELVALAKHKTKTRNRLLMAGLVAPLISLPVLWLFLSLARGGQFSPGVVLPITLGFTILG